MIDYRAGVWGFSVAFGLNGSLAPRALTMAVPNAICTFIIATLLLQDSSGDLHNGDPRLVDDNSKAAFEVINESSQGAQMLIASFTSIMIFILYNRSNTAYDRWWEGGTLLQKTRGEWFNAFSSIMAFTSTKPEHHEAVTAYQHLLARLMSLLLCCGLQQVSPNRDRPFEIIDLSGIEPASMDFLNQAPDKVEIILQWIQRSMVLHAQTGVLPVPPPILSRAFQEVSRGIVNLQNARKIADFPYPYPLAQVSMILQLLHYAVMPVSASLAMPRAWAVLASFFSIFVLWCIHFNALDLEFPFGTRVNDLPMNEFQQDWNKSICTLMADRATRPPKFLYNPDTHCELAIAMSDASDLYIPTVPMLVRGSSLIKVSAHSLSGRKRKSGAFPYLHAHSPPWHTNDSPPPERRIVEKNGSSSVGIGSVGLVSADRTSGVNEIGKPEILQSQSSSVSATIAEESSEVDRQTSQTSPESITISEADKPGVAATVESSQAPVTASQHLCEQIGRKGPPDPPHSKPPAGLSIDVGSLTSTSNSTHQDEKKGVDNKSSTVLDLSLS